MADDKRPSRLAQAMLETAKDMRSTGILDEADYNKIIMRHLEVKDKAVNRQRVKSQTGYSTCSK